MNNNQRDARWANQTLGNSTLTIGSDGCVVSCIGDALNTTPDVVNTLLKNNQGFDGALVIWSALSQAFPGISATVYDTYDNTAILQQLTLGNRVLVLVSAAPIGGAGEHCVEYIGNEQCKDPWTGTVRPTSDFPDVLGEWVSISGIWQQQASNQGLNTYGLDVTNQQTEQALLDLWDEHEKGLWIPVVQYNALKVQMTDLQSQITELQSSHVTDTAEIATLNGTIENLSGTNKNYATEVLDAQKQTTTAMNLLQQVYEADNLDTSGKTDAQLIEEVIQDLAKSRTLEQQQVQQTTPEGIASFYETTLKKVVDYALAKGINPFLQAQGWHVVDTSGNVVDDQLFDKLKLFFDDAFTKRDMIVAGLKNGGNYIAKAKTIWQQFTELFAKPTA